MAHWVRGWRVLVGWVAVAGATPGTSCVTGEIVGAVPQDGAVVPPEVVVEGAFEGGNCGFPGLQLSDESGEWVAADQEVLGDLLRLTPVEPLLPGTYTVWEFDATTFGEVRSTFVVEEGALLPRLTLPEGLEVSADRSCEGVATTLVVGTATFLPDPAGWGTVAFEVVTENGVQPTREQLWYGQSSVSVTTEVLGGREVCLSATVSSADRSESEVLDEVCADPFDGCPEGPLRGDGGCSCDHGSPGGIGVVAWSGFALLRRRRS